MNLQEQSYNNLKMYMTGREMTALQKADALIEFNELIDRTEWLEQRNKEQVEVLEEALSATHHSVCGLEWAKDERSQDFNEADGEHLIWLRKVENKIEEQLKKSE